MERKTCCVIGHRNLPQEKRPYIEAALRQEIMQTIGDGYTRFLCGFSEGTDLLFAAILAELKKEVPGLWLEAVISHVDFLYGKDRAFHDLIGACDNMKILSEKAAGDGHAAQHCYMVDAASRVIAVYDGREHDGTAETVRYANKQNKEVRTILI